jgi:hypothetical protein
VVGVAFDMVLLADWHNNASFTRRKKITWEILGTTEFSCSLFGNG